MHKQLLLAITSPFFRRGTEGVENQQLKPPQSPFEKGGRIFLVSLVILALIIASYYSLQRTRTYLLNNAIEFKLKKAERTKNKFDEYPVVADLVKESLAISQSNPRTYLLAGNAELRRLANNTVDSPAEFQKILTKAETYYIQGLKLQPDNPFLWVNLALVSSHQPGHEKRFKNALRMARKYGASHPEIKQMVNNL